MARSYTAARRASSAAASSSRSFIGRTANIHSRVASVRSPRRKSSSARASSGWRRARSTSSSAGSWCGTGIAASPPSSSVASTL